MPQPGVIRRRSALAALAVAAALLTACTPTQSLPSQTTPAAPSALPDGVTVSFVQLRSDVAARQAQVEVHNGTDRAIEVGDVSVSDPRFEGVASRVFERSSKISAGGTVDIRIQLPQMACGTQKGGMNVALTLLEKGAPVVSEAALPDHLDVIAPLHERECRAHVLAQAADVSLTSFTPSASGKPADLTLEIDPTGQGSAKIVGVQDTNLLTFSGPQAVGYPIDVTVTPDDTDKTTIHLPLVPLRCDPHAVQEDKRGTVFTFDVELDTVPGTVEIAASDDMRGKILTWVADWCGFGS